MRATQLVELAAALIATTLNLILIPIIITKSSVKMGPYKYFLLAYTITAALYSYCVSTSVFTWYLPSNGFLFICTLEFFPRWFEGIQVMLFAVCYFSTIIILVWSFIYRLSTLRSSGHWIQKHSWIPFSVFISVFPIAGTIVCFIFLGPAAKIENDYREEVMKALNLDLSTAFYLGGQFIIDDQLNLPLILILGICNIFFTSGIVICIVCWIKIGSKLKEIRQLTTSTYNYHHNFYILLTLQTCLPIAFYALPITVLIVMGLTQYSIDGFSYLCGMCLSFAQVLDPLLTIYFISDYKLFLLRKRIELLNYFGICRHSVHIFNSDTSGSSARM